MLSFPDFGAHARCYARDAARLMLTYLELPNMLSSHFSGAGKLTLLEHAHMLDATQDVTWLMLKRLVQLTRLDEMLCCDVSIYALKPATCESPT